MFKLKVGDKVCIKSDIGLNDYYEGIEFLIKSGKNNKYELSSYDNEDDCSGAGHFFTPEHFEYIQPEILTIEMACDPDVAINVRSQEEAEYFFEWLNFYNKKWFSTEKTNWEIYKCSTCYVCNGYFGSLGVSYKNKIIIRFDPSMIDDDLLFRKHYINKCYESVKNNLKTKPQNENRVLTDDDYKGSDDFMSIFGLKRVKDSNVSECSKESLLDYGAKELKSFYEKNKDQVKIYTLITDKPDITNIEFKDKETIVEFNGTDKVKVTCQNTDTYSKEQAIVQAIAKYNGFTTNAIEELIKKFDVKEKKEKWMTGMICLFNSNGDMINYNGYYPIPCQYRYEGFGLYFKLKDNENFIKFPKPDEDIGYVEIYLVDSQLNKLKIGNHGIDFIKGCKLEVQIKN